MLQVVGEKIKKRKQPSHPRPYYRWQCINQKRPCPYAGCRYHLYLDVDPRTGTIKINHPGKELWELEQTCALDVAAKCGSTLHEVGALLNVTRERIRQIEAAVLRKLKGLDFYFQ